MIRKGNHNFQLSTLKPKLIITLNSKPSTLNKKNSLLASLLEAYNEFFYLYNLVSYFTTLTTLLPEA